MKFEDKYRALILVLFLAFSSLYSAGECCAVDEFADIKWIDRLPMTDRDVVDAFEKAKSDSCEAIGEGEPLEITSPIRYLTRRDQKQKSPPLPAFRTGFLSIGLELSDTDRADLPVVSRSRVVEYLNSNYLLLQARIRKDLLDRRLYYHHRPIAVTARYSGQRVTQAFEPLVAQTTRNIRSLGVLVDSESRRKKAQDFRTLALIYYNEMVRPSSVGLRDIKVEQYEWVFVRGVESESSQSLEPHVFVTEENRTRLVYLHGFELPPRVQRTDVTGQIAITGFDRTGIFPESYLTRSYRLQQKQRYDWSKLSEVCLQTFGGDLDTHLNPMLDGLIQGTVDVPGVSN